MVKPGGAVAATLPPVLSHVQLAPLLAARQAGATQADLSLDLGLSTVRVTLVDAGVQLPDGSVLLWEAAAEIAGERNKCFVLHDGVPDDIAIFSPTTHWLRTLFPTERAPTMLVSGISMHRIKGIDPWEDTQRKIKAIAPIVGRVLDTATGLGYTAIAAARTASEVVTIELDPSGLEIARLNPWSQALFTDPKIKQIVGDAAEEIAEFGDRSFARIIHDPPMFSLGGDLYSGAFYAELYRVLTARGRLFHYVGDLDSASNRTLVPGILRRLKAAGFKRLVRHNEAFGIVAYKE